MRPLRFPMVEQRNRRRCGPRWLWRPNTAVLWGRERSAALAIEAAMDLRDASFSAGNPPLLRRLYRTQMRLQSLTARLCVGRLKAETPALGRALVAYADAVDAYTTPRCPALPI